MNLVIKMQEKRPQRKINRMLSFDYSTSGAYFITVCVKDRKPILSSIMDYENEMGKQRKVVLTRLGKIVEETIKNIPNIYSVIAVENYVIMPDHIHFLLRIRTDSNGIALEAPSIDRVIKQMKSCITKRIGFSIWQKSFFDHVIRNENDYFEVYKYIDNNPINWGNHDKTPTNSIGITKCNL